MALVKLAPYLCICGCGEHGYIALTDGRVSKHFFSKEEGRKFMEDARRHDLIDQHEETALIFMLGNLRIVSACEEHLSESTRMLKFVYKEVEDFLVANGGLSFVDGFSFLPEGGFDLHDMGTEHPVN